MHPMIFRMLTTLMFGLLMISLTFFVQNIYAAPAEPVPSCVAVATAGNIVIFRCVDEDTGTVLFVNSVGFMVVAP